MLKFISFPILMLLSSSFSNCKEKKTIVEDAPLEIVVQIGSALDYDLSKPKQTVSLSRDLREISGLAYSPASQSLLAINDEKGYIYLLDTASAKINSRIDFGKKSDYEGIAYKDGQIYIAESNGNFIVVDEDSGKKIDRFKTDLSRKNDIEGLAYNATTSSFLIAAKGSGSIKEKVDRKEKAIFSLDPNTQSVSKTPFISIQLEEAVEEVVNTVPSEAPLLTNYQKSRLGKFSPSGIAVHPISNHIYILSAKGKLLVRFNQKGKMLSTYFLDEKLNMQPEGICFGPDLTLYISNEGRAGKANILSYKYQK